MISWEYNPRYAPEEGGTYFPLIVCDACGEQVVEYGNVFWVVTIQTGEVIPGIWHTHKHACAQYDKVLEAEFGDGHMVLFEELNAWLKALVANVAEPIPR